MISEGHARDSGRGGASITVRDIPRSRKWPRRLDRWTHRHQDRRQGSEASHLVGYLSLLSLPHELSVAETGSLSGLWGEGWACVLWGPFTRGRKIIQTLRFSCRPSSFRHNGLPFTDPLLTGTCGFWDPELSLGGGSARPPATESELQFLGLRSTSQLPLTCVWGLDGGRGGRRHA